jgi:hypothetical protein
MTTRTLRALVLLAGAGLALPAAAHDVDCTNLVGLARPASSGATDPLLDPDGLPSLTAAPGAILTIDHYPAIVAFEIRVRNLAPEPSVVTAVTDAFLPTPDRVLSFGDALLATIPVGGALRRIHTVAVQSLEDCRALFDAAPSEQFCGTLRHNPFQVTTETDVASCQARVRCARELAPAPPPPPPPPAVCVGPSWTGDMKIPLTGITFAYDATLACDGTTWVAGSFTDPQSPSPLSGALFRLDPAGQLAIVRLDDALDAVHLDGNGFLDVAGRRRIGGAIGAGAVVRQLDPTGAQRWEYDPTDFAAGATDEGSGVDAGVDGGSNIYLAYRTTAPGRGSELALTKLDPTGAVVWSRQLGTDGDEELGHLAVSPGGGIWVAGTTTGVFPGQTGAGGQDAFLAHLDADGNLLWVRQLGSAGADRGGGVALDPGGSGRAALVGATAGPLDGGAPASAGFSDAFVAVVDGAGTLEWLRELRATPAFPATPTGTSAGAVAIDDSGAVWVGGAVTLGTVPGGTFFGQSDAIVARYDPAGSFLWARQFGAGEADTITHLTIDPAGSGIATENIHVSLSFRDAHVIRLSPDGT